MGRKLGRCAPLVQGRLDQLLLHQRGTPPQFSELGLRITQCSLGRLSDRCLSCLSVTLVYCGQTVGWMKMKLSVEVGPGHIALNGDSATIKNNVARAEAYLHAKSHLDPSNRLATIHQHPLRDFHKICRVCTTFQDALGVKIWLDLLKGLRSYGGFKFMGSGYPQIFSACSFGHPLGSGCSSSYS